MTKPTSKFLSFSSIRAFFSSERGVTAVEFAMLSPVFLGVTFMILQLGLYQMYSASLSYATQEAARHILIGDVANTNNITTTTFLSNFVCPNLAPPMTCDRVVINSQVLPVTASWWTLINATATGLKPVPLNNNQASFCIGRSGSTVALQMYYAMPTISFPFFGAPSSTFNGSAVIWIVSTAAFRNEPFNITSGYTGC